jgi:predicted secreted protein with PEFG-CTERM motif
MVVSLSLISIVFAEPEILCSNCVRISPYDVDLYKELFPLIVWTDSETYDHQSVVHVQGHLRPQNTVAPILVVVANPIGNVVSVEQFTTDSGGNFSFDLNTASSLFKQNGDYVLKVQSSSDTQQFKTKFTLVSSIYRMNECSSNEISVVASGGNRYCIPFKSTNGVLVGSEGKLNLDTKTITIDIRGQDVNSLVLDIPRSILDSKSTDGADSNFILMSGGTVMSYTELENDIDSRQIQIDYLFNGKDTFEIIGTKVVPEFGSIVMLIMSASITVVLIFGKSFSNKFVKF